MRLGSGFIFFQYWNPFEHHLLGKKKNCFSPDLQGHLSILQVSIYMWVYFYMFNLLHWYICYLWTNTIWVTISYGESWFWVKHIVSFCSSTEVILKVWNQYQLETIRNANFRLHFKPTKFESLRVQLRNLCSKKHSWWLWCTLKFENHCSRTGIKKLWLASQIWPAICFCTLS